ncbi:MAG: hypothetical protein DRH51_06030 [Candidatus Coatesbacteria bacterium]|nr:MAG: hypothetical protein DRH51_06030 [Candidatus Coatesbacteria bacterium]RLC43155.1 MAG: hypothetical protein DRH49_02080 [Candidatus Coatesbacteria bacterium]RLC44797.1 MAG: hypothetical protein DRH44_01250 [Candidatus Coatesbacteria bacterium]HEC80296.1 B12-binding domain-containing radical SAM protein [Bacillota bacterium]
MNITFIKTGHIKRDYKASPPLGIMYLASVIRSEIDADISIIDTRLGNLTNHEVLRKLVDTRPDMVGFSTFTLEAPQMHSLADDIKREFSDVLIMAGGPHASADPKRVLEDNNIDFVIIGEGEETIKDVLRFHRGEMSISDVYGTAFRSNGDVAVNPPRPFIEDLDSIPFPAWDLIDREAYFNLPRLLILYRHKEYMPIFTSRACPYRCIYCHRLFGKRFRARSPENVLDEITILYNEYGIREFEVFDDVFNCHRERAKKILRMFVESGMDATLQFPNGLRGDLVDDELIYWLKRAGAFRLSIAVETASPRLQKYIKKYIKLDKIKPVVKKLTKAGINVHGLFMLGFPTETRQELHQTIKFAVNGCFNTASFFIVNPFEGTELADIARKLGYRINSDPNNYDYFSARFNLSQVSDEELTYLLRVANIKFYFNWRRVISFLKLITTNVKVVPHLVKLFFQRLLFARAGG